MNGVWSFSSVVKLNQICKERCEVFQLQCILDCTPDDITYLSKCIRDVTGCFSGKLSMLHWLCHLLVSIFIFTKISPKLIYINISACPCEIDCLDGCTDCTHPVCQCDLSVSLINNGPRIMFEPLVSRIRNIISIKIHLDVIKFNRKYNGS